MTTIEVVHENIIENPEAETEAAVEDVEPEAAKDIGAAAAVMPDWSALKVKNLSKAQRNKLIEDFDAGVENDYFKIQKLRNGSVRIVKRSNPLNADTENVGRSINEKYNGKRLTTEQLLLEHVLELERKYEVMRQKHKKLKKRYNRLETDLFESDDEEPVETETISRAVTVEPEAEVEPSVEAQPEKPAPIITATFRKKPVRGSWRDMISSM